MTHAHILRVFSSLRAAIAADYCVIKDVFFCPVFKLSSGAGKTTVIIWPGAGLTVFMARRALVI